MHCMQERTVFIHSTSADSHRLTNKRPQEVNVSAWLVCTNVSFSPWNHDQITKLCKTPSLRTYLVETLVDFLRRDRRQNSQHQTRSWSRIFRRRYAATITIPFDRACKLYGDPVLCFIHATLSVNISYAARLSGLLQLEIVQRMSASECKQWFLMRMTTVATKQPNEIYLQGEHLMKRWVQNILYRFIIISNNINGSLNRLGFCTCTVTLFLHRIISIIHALYIIYLLLVRYVASC